VLLQYGLGKMNDVLDDMPNGHGHCGQHKQTADENELVIALEAILHGVHNEQRDHDDGEDDIGDNEQRAYPDAPLLEEASYVQAAHLCLWCTPWECSLKCAVHRST